MSLRILVTGGAGYLGSTLVPMLLEAGHEVTVLDNFLYRQNSLAQLCHLPRFHIKNADIRDENAIRKALQGVDAVIPLAALVGAPLCDRDPSAAKSVNLDAALALFRAASREQWILMPTTNSAYGSSAPGKAITEEAPLNPLSLYARHKVEVEKELMQRENAISFRLATVFGMSPRMRIDLLVNDFAYRAVYDRFVVLFEAHFKRNYIHVRDVGRAFSFGLENFSRLRGQIYNVGLSSANLSKKELCDVIAQIVPGFTALEAPVGKDPDQRNYIVSNEKIERTGFVPQHSLPEGVRELVKGYQMIKNSRFGNV
jgi:nucleoside-diphosphate-sugar epimerase